MAALRLELRASRALAGVLALVHGAGAACVAFFVPGYPGGVLALLVLALGAASARERALLRASGSVRALELGAGGAAILERVDGRRLAARVGERRHVGPWWVVLPVEGESRCNLVVVRDMLPPPAFRSLRLWALWGRVPLAPPQHAA